MKHLEYYAYGYLKKTSELNPYGVIAQSLEPDETTKKINYNFFASPKSVIGIHGLNCDIMAMGIISLRYARLTKNRAFAQIAYDQINWVLGKNLLGFCMLSGKGTTNPFMQVSDWNKGPVLGGIPNGFVCPEERNIPKWMADWNSGEYWKPHNAMLLVLMAELESKLLSNPFKLKIPKKHNTKLEKIYKELDKIKTDKISK